MTKHFNLIYLLALFHGNCALATELSSKAHLPYQWSKYFSTQERLGRFSGSVAVIANSKILFRRSYGIADLNSRVLHSPDSPFPIASVSKQFVAGGILRAARQGRFSLTDPISKHLKTPPHWNDIIISQIVSHSSGLRQITQFPQFYEVIGSTIPLFDIVTMFQNEKLNGTPGKNYEYSQYGYHVLAALLEATTKMPYSRYLQENIYRPGLMKSTFHYRENMIVRDLVRGTEVDENGVRPRMSSVTTVGNRTYAHYFSMNAIGAGGDIVSSLDDLIRWDFSLRSGKVFNKTDLDLYQSELFRLTDRTGYGFGLLVEQEGPHRLVSHGGGLAGISTAVLRYLDLPLTVYVLSNRVCSYKDPEVNKTCSANFHARKIAKDYLGAR